MEANGNGRMRVLTIGVGSPVNLESWPGAEVVSLDVAEEAAPDYLVDCLWNWNLSSSELFPFAEDITDEHFDLVVATHALQCVPRVRVVETLKYWSGVLRPGGELHVIVPDLGWAADEIAAERSVEKMTLGVIYGTQQAEWAYHRSGFTVDLLRAAVFAAGLQARAARLGPYKITSVGADGKVRELVARQIYVVAVKPNNGSQDKADRHGSEDETDEEAGDEGL